MYTHDREDLMLIYDPHCRANGLSLESFCVAGAALPSRYAVKSGFPEQLCHLPPSHQADSDADL